MMSTTPRGSGTIVAVDGNVVMAAGTWIYIRRLHILDQQKNGFYKGVNGSRE
jgi:hypothetical protein